MLLQVEALQLKHAALERDIAGLEVQLRRCTDGAASLMGPFHNVETQSRQQSVVRTSRSARNPTHNFATPGVIRLFVVCEFSAALDVNDRYLSLG